MRRELKELKEKQDAAKATLEQLVADTANRLQEQLDELRSVLGSTTPATQPPSSAEQDEAPCPVCSTDVGAQLGRLLQRYEQLQELVESVSARQAAGKAGRQRQDEELLKHIQAAVTQVQGDCEKLSSVTGNLMDDRHQRQRDIEALFQSLERLEKEKVDKEELVLEIDVKADRAALAGKVSCAQFDAAMEQLNGMIGEMLSKVTGQEQDWHQVQQKLIEELDSKLDRLELAPLRQQLEERWRSILKQLKEKTPRVEADDAAGIRKQLLAHFHCVSCDRPLHMLVPGPHIVTIPPLPPLPSRVTVRPRATFQPEQGHRWGTRGQGDHSWHRGGLSPEHPPAPRREQGAQCGFLQVPRRCGGQHTVTHPLQRCPRPPHLPPYGNGTSVEVEIWGRRDVGSPRGMALGHRGGEGTEVSYSKLGGWEGLCSQLGGVGWGIGVWAEREGEDLHGTGWVLDPVPILTPKPRPSSGCINPVLPPGTPRLLEQRPMSSHGRLPHLRPPQGREESPTAERGGGTPSETHPWAPGGPMGCSQ
uniref:DUF4795 domain-containing protein n=1 Tax=Meleagris gallopavo TaxID=9103 RepID=G1MYF8_MELGA